MAFTASNLHLRAGAPGALTYYYTTSDTMAQVIASGYFQNVTYLTKLVAGDVIYVVAADGYMWVKVSAVTAAGAVTVQFAGGNLPIQTYATGTEAALAKGLVGYYEFGTSIATATRVVLPTPYPGAQFMARKIGSGTQAVEFDAGASASGVSDGSGGGTGVTYDGTRRRVTFKAETEGFHAVGSSTSRWRIQQLLYNASAISEGGSVVFLGT